MTVPKRIAEVILRNGSDPRKFGANLTRPKLGLMIMLHPDVQTLKGVQTLAKSRDQARHTLVDALTTAVGDSGGEYHVFSGFRWAIRDDGSEGVLRVQVCCADLERWTASFSHALFLLYRPDFPRSTLVFADGPILAPLCDGGKEVVEPPRGQARLDIVTDVSADATSQ